MRHHFVRDHVEKNVVIEKIYTNIQLGEILTKPLVEEKFKMLYDKS